MNENSKKDFVRCSLRLASAQICQSLGWHAVHRSSHDILTDILERYLKHVSTTAVTYSQNYCRTAPNLEDVSLAFKHLGIHLNELEDYVHQVESVGPACLPPTIPYRGEKNQLVHAEEGQFPPLVDMKEILQEHIVEVKTNVLKEEEKENEIDHKIISPNKIHRPKELILRTDSVESPPYSPLEPKSLNVDAFANTDLTRPGLKVTTPKGYTPTLTTQAPVLGIASFTNVHSKIESPVATSIVVTPTPFNTNSPLKSKTRKEKSKSPREDKVRVKKEENTALSPKTSRTHLKSPAKHKHDLLSPKSNTTSHKSNKSPKPIVPIAGITGFIKTSNLSEKLPVTKKITSTLTTVNDSIAGTSTVKIKEEPSDIVETPAESASIVLKHELPDSPPPLALPPQVVISPTPTMENDPPINEIKCDELSPITPSRTVIFPSKSETSPTPTKLELSPPSLFPSSDLLSPEKKSEMHFSNDSDETPSSVLLSPVPMDMPVLTLEKKAETSPDVKSEPEIDILSVSQDELQPTIKERKSLHRGGEEKKKKKKKKSEKYRDEKNRKHEGKEKKEKKKKREGKESNTPIPKLTFKLGGEKISEAKASMYSAESIVVPAKTSSKKHKTKRKESKHKEQLVSHSKPTSSIFVETLTNTSSALGGEVYYCPTCGLPDDGSPMIGCDSCDDLWYHWPCVNITVEPADDEKWYCPKCSNDAPPAKKKKKKKKRDS